MLTRLVGCAAFWVASSVGAGLAETPAATGSGLNWVTGVTGVTGVDDVDGTEGAEDADFCTPTGASSVISLIMAAAMIKEMTEDAPVGVQKSASSAPSVPSTSSTPVTPVTPVTQFKPEPVAAGVSASPAPTDDATQKAAQPTRRVSITAEYETKISSLLSSYEATKQKQREAALRQPKQVVEVSAEEIARATKKTNPVIVFFLKIVAMIQACFAYVRSLLTGDSPSSSGSPPATA